MTKKPHKQTPAEAAAGQANLEKWIETHPSRGNLRHGAFSRVVRQKYSDRRSTEGKQLAKIMEGLVRDLGGEDQISSAQRLLLDSIQAKLVIILQISKFVDRQPSIISPSGELLPCLGRGFTTYSEALRRDLEALLGMGKKRSKVPTIEDIIRQGEKEEQS